jgi:cysteinyl-tRNA synthetase
VAIRVYDTLHRAEVDLIPRDEGRISMYACGPTVYGYVHIGNARTILWYDEIRRYLSYRGYELTYVSNYTDVDDKIIERAKLEGISPDEVARKYAAAFEADMDELSVEPPTILVKATDHIEDMVKAIEGLIERGSAYEAGGDVYFSVESFRDYGKLSHRSLDDMRAGERVEPGEHKRNPLDFALWKAAKEGEPAWDSPWGPGRPGWHIECSVMSTKYLGMGFDLHGGATDLIFPHHENEIAQAEALVDDETPFARHWVHAGLVRMESEKMSKSLGNVVLTKDLLERFPGEVVRYWALTGSYRSQATFSDESLADATQAYDRLKNFHDAAMHVLEEEFPEPSATRRPIDTAVSKDLSTQYVARFIEAMDDDFNSASALAALHEAVRDGNRLLEDAQRGDAAARSDLEAIAAQFAEIAWVLNLRFEASPGPGSEMTSALVEFLLELREEARREKAFGRADAIRDRLQSLGVTIEDTPSGPRWRVGSD